MGKLKMVGVCIFLTIIQNIYSQEYKFGKVSKEELLEKSNPLDSSANATVLYENKKVAVKYNSTDGFQLITEIFKRIKLYNKDGFDYATEEIFLYKNNSNEEKVSSLKAYTYSIINGEIKETKLKKDGVFEDEYSENYDQYKFTMPAIQEGAVIEYKYKIISPFLSTIDRVYLQYEIPIKKIEVQIQTPEYFNYKKFSTGYLPINLKESSFNDKIIFTSKTRSGGGFSSVTKTSYSRDAVEHKVNVNKVTSVDVPAFKEEPFSGNKENYISSLSYELSYVKYPNEPIDYRSTTWEDVTKTIFKNSNFGGELKKTTYYKEDIDKLIEGETDQIKKISLIYNFVKQKMSWNKKRSVITNKGVKKAYKEGTGNAAEINLMLTSILAYARIDANPVVVSTSDRLINLFPTLNGFNYVITRVKLADNSVFYLDATDKYGMPNILPDRVMRGIGRVIAKNGTSQLVNFRPQKPSQNLYNVQCEVNPEGVVQGKFNIRRLNYNAHAYRETNGALSEDSKIERLQKRYGLSEIENYEVKGVKEYGKGVTERCSFTLDDQAEVIENELFLSPLLFLRDKENVFKSDSREYPVDFGHGFSNVYRINIKIPDGYQVVESPESKIFKLPDNLGVFSYKSDIANNLIQLYVNEKINVPIITAQHYLTLKEFYNQIIQKENEQVVLKKI